MNQIPHDPLAMVVAQQAEVRLYRYGQAQVAVAMLYFVLVASGIVVLAQSVLRLFETPCSSISLLWAVVFFWFVGRMLYPVRSVCCDARGVNINYWLGSRMLPWQELAELRLEQGNNMQLCVLCTKDHSLRLAIDGVWGLNVLRDWRMLVKTIVERASMQFSGTAGSRTGLDLPGLSGFLRTFGYSGVEATYLRRQQSQGAGSQCSVVVGSLLTQATEIPRSPRGCP